jgi:beclin
MLIQCSTRDSNRVCCQISDCCAILTCSTIPVDYETILRQLFPELESDPSIHLDDFKALADRGDSASFAALLAQTLSAKRCIDIELPLCDSCMEKALQQREKMRTETTAARDEAIRIRNALRAQRQSSSSSSSSSSTLIQTSTLTSLMQSLKEEEENLLAEIAHAQQRLVSARALRLPLRQKRAQLASLEKNLWIEGRSLARTLYAGKEKAYALQLREARGRQLLSKLRCLLAPSDAFFLWHRGPFATVNSARLGRLPGFPVEWSEINAALGQLAFLLATVAGRVGFIFTKYRLIPMGSYSRIVPVIDDRTSYELYFDEGNFFFAQSRLNNALKALVFCVAELGAFAEASDRSFRLPYAIAASGDRVAGDLNVTVGKDVPWTRAMKLVVTNVKWLVSWSFRMAGEAL